tara:strand:+ start:481 stop:933 length:453 start_codon:yes stop_codon:yes gene_type:complete
MAKKFITYKEVDSHPFIPPEDTGGLEPDNSNPGPKVLWRYLGFNTQDQLNYAVIFDGVTLPSQPDEIACTEVDLSADADMAAKFAESSENTKHHITRSMEYPNIGDQLDGILKYIKAKKEAGETLPSDLDGLITKWEATKTKYPKEGLLD